RGSYRPAMTPQDAIKEMRRVAGRQFDGELVELFIEMIQQEDPRESSHPTDEADFRAELDFERRVRAIAQPY
ncbi:MAG: hypothetical protein ACYDA6_11965, partial [Solirubrobacteraceae bacterium]